MTQSVLPDVMPQKAPGTPSSRPMYVSSWLGVILSLDVVPNAFAIFAAPAFREATVSALLFGPIPRQSSAKREAPAKSRERRRATPKLHTSVATLRGPLTHNLRGQRGQPTAKYPYAGTGPRPMYPYWPRTRTGPVPLYPYGPKVPVGPAPVWPRTRLAPWPRTRPLP
jgi:hypothetical protein